ncbi:MAG TPA: MerR family transcriptional regulator [Streptosporangiaceae bacterium]|jgi:DNA-binding transcriptional MerR regulator
MRIGELSERTGVPSRLLRYYDEQGLLSPARAGNGFRDYEESAVAQVAEIRQLLDAGLPIRIIKAVRPSADADPALIAEIERYHDVLDARVRCLARNRDALAAYLAAVRARA